MHRVLRNHLVFVVLAKKWLFDNNIGNSSKISVKNYFLLAMAKITKWYTRELVFCKFNRTFSTEEGLIKRHSLFRDIAVSHCLVYWWYGQFIGELFKVGTLCHRDEFINSETIVRSHLQVRNVGTLWTVLLFMKYHLSVCNGVIKCSTMVVYMMLTISQVSKLDLLPYTLFSFGQ